MIELEMDQLFSSELTESGVFTPDPDTPAVTIPCQVIIGREVELRSHEMDIEYVEIGTTVTALYPVIGAPERNSFFEVDGSTYTVARMEENNRVLITVVVNES